MTIEFEVTIANPVTGGATMVMNQGTVRGDNFTQISTDDPDTGAPADTTITLLEVQADLTVSKADSSDPVDAGAALAYTLDVFNNGPDTASNITVTDTLPAGVSFNSASGVGWSCGQALGVVTCTRPSLAPGAAPQITVQVTAPSEGGSLTNNVCVTSDTADPASGNNCDAETTGVTARADLSVSKSDAPDPVDGAAALTYTLEVSNAGPSTAASVTVTDTLPSGVTFGSAVGTGWTCGEALGVVTCTRASLAVAVASAITISLTAPSEGGTITNNVCVTTTTSDPQAGNDCDAEQTTVTARADLSVTKDDAADPVDAASS